MFFCSTCMVLNSQTNGVNCAQDRSITCPAGLIPSPVLFCDGASDPAILRNNLGPGIIFNPLTLSFDYTDTAGANISRPFTSGLIRTFFARVPDLRNNSNNNGVSPNAATFNTLVDLGNQQWRHTGGDGRIKIYTQRTERDSNKPIWRYFKKKYFYNVKRKSREQGAICNEDFPNSCWIEIPSSLDLDFDNQGRWNNNGGVSHIAWVEGADRPRNRVPLQRGPAFGGRSVWISPNRTGCLIVDFDDDPSPAIFGNVLAFTPAGVSRVLFANPAITADLSVPYNLNPGEFIAFRTTALDIVWSLFNTIPGRLGITRGADFQRSPDNICLYGTEFPMLGIDYNR